MKTLHTLAALPLLALACAAHAQTGAGSGGGNASSASAGFNSGASANSAPAAKDQGAKTRDQAAPAAGSEPGFNRDADRARTEARMRRAAGAADLDPGNGSLGTPGGPGGVGGTR